MSVEREKRLGLPWMQRTHSEKDAVVTASHSFEATYRLNAGVNVVGQARLMAAAPELAEVLELCFKELPMGPLGHRALKLLKDCGWTQ